MNMRKTYQRKLNKKVRALNKNVREDNLWMGRFEMRQKYAKFEEFEDKSGGVLYTIMRIVDKKDGYYKDYSIDFAPYLYRDWKLWEAMNEFITESARVWNETPGPRDDNFVIDFTNTKINEEIIEKPYNFYLAKEFFFKENNE